MEDPKSNYKTVLEDKDYFSAYLIMARHNVYITLNEISETILGITTDEENLLSESKLFSALAENKINDKHLPPQTTGKLIEKLEQHFPFVRPMLQKELKTNNSIILQPKDYVELFKILLGYLDFFRNYYTHTNHKMYKNSRDLLKYLRSSFDAAVRKVRDEMGVEESEIVFLRRLEKKRGEKNATEKPEFEYKFYDEENENISEKGLAYFICLFLEPKYNMLFLKKLKGFKRNYDKKYRIVRNCYRCYSIRLPQLRLNEKDTKESLGMDILSELKRCPSELFNHINQRDKEKFFYNKNRSEEEIERNGEGEDEGMKKLIRMEDRFPFFALSYIDYQKLFEKLRFQVDLGDYYYKFYDKLTIDNKLHLRSLSKKMKAYGRIEDFDMENQPEAWKELCKQTHSAQAGETEKYITQTQPHYHINNNLITLASTDNINKHNVFPETEEKRFMPDFFLSTHELLGLLFYNYLLLREKGNREKYPAEKLIFKHREKIYRFFDDIISGKLSECSEEELKKNYDLTKREIPERLLLLLGMKEKINSQETVRKQKLDQMILDTKILLRKSRTDEQRAKNSKAGSYKREKVIKSGGYAFFLAKDMVFLRETFGAKTSETNKITSLNFQVLQSSLAFYDRDKELLEGIFRQCRFFSKDTAHPFLKEVCYLCMNDKKKNNIVSFYQTYLQKRIGYLIKCKNNLSECRFFKSRNETELKELAQKHKDSPINLPRGLFKNAITEHFKTGSNGDNMKNSAEKDKTSTSFLLEQYFLHCLQGDKPLNYYTFKRTYSVINKMKDNRENFYKPLPLRYYDTQELTELAQELKEFIGTGETIERRSETMASGRRNEKPALHYETMRALYNQFCENEKIIRTYKAQDMMLFLMGKELLFDKEELDFKLKDVLFDNTDKAKGQETEKDTLSVNKRYEIKIHGKTIFQDDLKPKNYEDFKRFVKDRRLPSLFDWIEGESIERKFLERELENYDKARMAILEQIYRFEHVMFEKYPDELEIQRRLSTKYAKKSYYPFNIILDTYQLKYPVSNEDKELIREIRNKFSYNEYPEKCFFSPSQVKQISGERVTKDIELFAIEKLKELIKSIGNESGNM